MGEEMTVQLVAPVSSSEENGGKFATKNIPKEGNVNRDTSTGVEREENDGHLESKDDRRDLNIYQDDFLEGEAENNREHLLLEDGKYEMLESREEVYETGSLGDKGSDDSNGKSEYNSLSGSDAEDDSSPFSCRSQLKFAQAVSSHQESVFQNTENEIAFGGSDWGEHWRGHEGEINGSMEVWEVTKQQDPGHGQVVLQTGVHEEGCIELDDLDDVPDAEYLSGDTSQVRGTGRPDLDDDEDDFEGRFIPQPFRSTLVHSPQNSGSPRPDLEEECVFSDYSFTEEEKVGAIQDPSKVTSGLGLGTFREEMDDILELEFDFGAQEKLKNAFATRSSEKLEETVALERQEGEASDGPNCLSRTQFVEEVEHSIAKAGLWVKVPSLDVQEEARVGLTSMLKLIPNSLKYDVHHEAEQDNYLLADTITEVVNDGSRKKGSIMHLDSSEAEELLRMDVSKVGKPVYNPKGSNVQDHKRAGVDWAAEDLGPDELSRYVEALEVKETYIDTVLDMEDILFDAEEGSGARILQVGKIMSPGAVRPIRDGSLSASTSSHSASVTRQLGWSTSTLTEVDWIEVVGASQRRGGASLGERVVGVKEHTIYRIKVKSGGNEWEVHRRYREFVALYSQLQQLFPRKENFHLPTPWEKVKAESRKLFGNTSPDVVDVRSSLIQVCLQSLLQAGPPLSTAAPLLRFVHPAGVSTAGSGQASGKHVGEGKSASQALLDDFDFQQYSPTSNTLSGRAGQDQDDGQSVFGKTIRLIVQIHKKKSLKQQLQAQHYTCAGCYKHLELALGLVPELVQNWGWRGPRLCEYSGQLFCSTCHLNETAVIPAWVLQRWDFAPRQVSQLAKAYLDSIYDKPMLCVSAVNPYLYVRVPVLAHLTDIRRKLSKILACIRCPARARIQAMLGSRRYLLENNDFFALRDLADLSKGAFAVLPEYMRTILLKLSLHIKRECYTCRDLGETCGAKDLCDDPLDVIYPYQDENITRCQSCHLPYHKKCFQKCQKICSCRKKGQSDQMLDSRHSSDILYTELGTETCPRIGLPASGALETEDSPASSSSTVNENKGKAKRNLFTNLLGPKEAQGSESQRETRNSISLNMSALLSPLEL